MKSFLEAHPGPLVEARRVVFLYQDPAARVVELGGDFTGWGAWLPLQRLAGTDLFYRVSRDFPGTARVEYRFRVDGREVADPGNPQKIDNGVGGENAVLAMPGYLPAPVSKDPLQGKLETFQLPTPGGGVRKLTVYTPAGAKGPLPSLYIHDGREYLERAQLARVAEDQVQAGRMTPTLLIFVDPLERRREYDREEAFTREVVESIVPFVDARFPTRRDPAWRGVMGASMGGLISLHLGMTHPEVFGRVASQSGAFAHHPEVRRQCASSPPQLKRLYLDVGLYDLGFPGLPTLLQANRRLSATLQGRVPSLFYREYPGGHSWTAWRDELPGLLVFLFPARRGE